MSDESDYESDDTDQVLAVDEHILPVTEPYWCDDYEFRNSCDDELCYDDELWLSAVSWEIVTDKGAIELSSLLSSSSPGVPVPKTITLPLQWGDACICWYSALMECWTEAKLLPAQEELTRESHAAGSAAVEQIPQGSVPVNLIDSSSPPPTEPGAIPPSRNLSPGPSSPEPPDRGRFPMARTYCTHSHCDAETTMSWDGPAGMVPSGVCDCCFGYSSAQWALVQGACSEHIEALWCAHEHCDSEVT